MKRNLIIAAIAVLCSGAALAQSQVTVYGRLNVTAERQKSNGVSQKVLQDNASRLGFKGSEDLGGGLSANFFLEHRFSADTGTVPGAFWAGDSWVSLGSGFGEVRLGRQTSAAYYATADYVSLHNHDTGTSADALYSLGFQGYFDSNKISYLTPSIAGFQGEVQLAAGEGVQPRGIELAGNYALGDLALGAGYTELGDDKQVAVRALYNLGAFTVGGYYQRTEMDDTFGDGKANIFRLSGMYTMGASEFHVNAGRASDIGNVNDTGAKQYTLGYNYNLSKRTKIYGFATKIDADAFTPYTQDFSSLAVGVRHSF